MWLIRPKKYNNNQYYADTRQVEGGEGRNLFFYGSGQ